MMGYELIIWDFDGTLADTFACLVRAYNVLAPRRGFRTLDDPEAAHHMPLPALLRSLGIPLVYLPSFTREVLAAVRREMAGIRLFPGIAEVLRELGDAGRRMCVLSSNAPDNIRTCLRTNGVEGLFASVAGYSRLLGKAKGLRRLLRSQEVDDGQAVYVGDEVRDVEAARKAGLPVAAVTWGFQSRDLLAAGAPDHLIDRPEQLLAALGAGPRTTSFTPGPA
jgi:phosphoglycolate phosphatase-like HAD superfamily hydrolase